MIEILNWDIYDDEFNDVCLGLCLTKGKILGNCRGSKISYKRRRIIIDYFRLNYQSIFEFWKFRIILNRIKREQK